MKPYRLQEVRLSLVRSRRPSFEVHNPRDIAQAFAHLSRNVREEFYAIFLDAANTVICVDHVSTGSIGKSPAEPAEILRTALLVGARALVLVHNHPSGSTTPSADDRQVTTAIADAATLFDIRVFDHLIIGHHGAYFSFADAGLMPSGAHRRQTSSSHKTVTPLTHLDRKGDRHRTLP